MVEVERKKRVDQRQVSAENAVVDAAGTHRAARHQKAVLHIVLKRAVELLGKGCVMNIKKAVFPAAVCKGGNAELRTDESAGEKRGVAAAGNVKRAVRILLCNSLQLLFHLVCVEKTGFEENKLCFDPAMREIIAYLLLPSLILHDLLRTEKDRALGAKDLGRQYIFQRAVVIELDQGFHG